MLRWILEAMAKSDLSLNERVSIVSRAVSKRFNDGPGDYSYADLIFDDFVIIRKNGKLYRATLEWTADGDVQIGEPALCYQAFPLVQTQEATRFEGQVFGLLPDDAAVQQVKEGEGQAEPAATGRRWNVLIIQEGMSKNRNNYRRTALKEAAHLYEGAKMYADHAAEVRPMGRSIHEQVGFLKDVKPCVIMTQAREGEGNAPGVLALAATAVITKAAIRQEMLEAYQEGNPNLFGLSHDAMCKSTTVMGPDGRAFYDVTKIESVASVDLVTNPAAGGRVMRLVASNTVPTSLTEDEKMLTKMIEAIKASGNQALIRKFEAITNPTEDQVLAIYNELQRATESGANGGTQPAGTQGEPARTTEATQPAATQPAARATEQAQPQPQAQPGAGERRVTEAEWRDVMVESRTNFLESSLAACTLPEPARALVRRRFTEAMGAGSIPTKDAITAAIKEQVEVFGQMAEQGMIQMPARGVASRITMGAGPSERFVEAANDFFGVKADSSVRGGFKVVEPKAMMSFRRFYADFTGDRDITGRVAECTRLTEAIGSATFDQAMGDAITRRMVAEYVMAQDGTWRNTIAEVVPLGDFRTQRRIRIGGYGNLSVVTERGAYPALSTPGDEEATYAPAKRGGTEELSIEAIANDDVGVIRRIPSRMAQAAVRTLNESVFDLLRTNPTIYDSTALFAVGHNNLGSTALSSTQLNALRLMIRKQTQAGSAKRIGLPARYLIVPADLEELAFHLTNAVNAMPDSNIASTAASGAPNFIRKVGIQPIVVDYWTDANDYFVTSSVRDVPMIEVGFFGGREEPELFVQDTPNQGSLFANDVITYKIRHIYGMGVQDYRGFAGALVS